jgi:hypothetical protein
MSEQLEVLALRDRAQRENASPTPSGMTVIRSGATPSMSTSSPRENSDTVMSTCARRASAGNSRRW